ncbi:MAG: hypothetical protein JKY96_04835 [Phycisphaerales bacterium]|nr:hypothetical protein [Phycisphaerales bacterium]
MHRFIGYYENSGEGLTHYKNWLWDWRDLRSATFGQHFGPHDLKVRELGSGKSRHDSAREIGLEFKIVNRIDSKADGIESSRRILPQCAFDEENCAQGIKHLDNYRADFDDKHGIYKSTPRHDAASHGADGFQTFSTGWKQPTIRKLKSRRVKGIH